MRIIDRYVLRQVLPPMLLALLVFTFVLLIPGLIEYAEDFIAKGVSPLVVATAMLTLVPSALALTIPMSVLVGLLVAFARLSSDREFVAMQACGLSLVRLLRPVGLVAVVALGRNVLRLSGRRARQQPGASGRSPSTCWPRRPRARCGRARSSTSSPTWCCTCRTCPPPGAGTACSCPTAGPAAPRRFTWPGTGGWRSTGSGGPSRCCSSRAPGTPPIAEDAYEVFQFDRLVIVLDPETYFPRQGPRKGVNELTIAELRTADRRAGAKRPVAAQRADQDPPEVLDPRGLPGVRAHRDRARRDQSARRRAGQLRARARGHLPVLRPDVPGPGADQGRADRAVAGRLVAQHHPGASLGLLLFRWRGRSADRPLRIPLPSFGAGRAGSRATGR